MNKIINSIFLNENKIVRIITYALLTMVLLLSPVNIAFILLCAFIGSVVSLTITKLFV